MTLISFHTFESVTATEEKNGLAPGKAVPLILQRTSSTRVSLGTNTLPSKFKRARVRVTHQPEFQKMRNVGCHIKMHA